MGLQYFLLLPSSIKDMSFDVRCEASLEFLVLCESRVLLAVRCEATVLLSVLLHSSVPAFLSPAFSPVPVGRGESLITSVSHTPSGEAATTT